jgi:hypothetical protein
MALKRAACNYGNVLYLRIKHGERWVGGKRFLKKWESQREVSKLYRKYPGVICCCMRESHKLIGSPPSVEKEKVLYSTCSSCQQRRERLCIISDIITDDVLQMEIHHFFISINFIQLIYSFSFPCYLRTILPKKFLVNKSCHIQLYLDENNCDRETNIVDATRKVCYACAQVVNIEERDFASSVTKSNILDSTDFVHCLSRIVGLKFIHFIFHPLCWWQSWQCC